VYHSIFDNFRWMKQFGDPAFRYHVAAAKIYGLETLRLAEADILPLDYETYGVEIQRHLGGIATKLALLGQSTQLDMRPAQSAAKQLAAAGKALTKRRQTLLASNAGAATLYGVNRTLVTTEREFLVSAGLPRRPWFKHSIFGPGFYNGYAPVPLPGVLEMIDARNFDEARRQLQAVTGAIERATARLRKSVPAAM
jgi:N-acetylated-alpha-linked acidic dipeptidase